MRGEGEKEERERDRETERELLLLHLSDSLFLFRKLFSNVWINYASEKERKAKMLARKKLLDLPDPSAAQLRGCPPSRPLATGLLLPQSFAVTHLFLLPGTTQHEGTLSTSRKCSPLQGGPLPAAEASSQVLLANSNSEVPHPFFSFCFLSKVSWNC